MAATNTREKPMYRSGKGWAAPQPSLPMSPEILDEEHFVRRLLPLVADIFGKDLRADCNLSGGFRYDPVNLIAIWIYGYLQGDLSSRKLEERCRYDSRYQFLAGSSNPDHTTLSRFRASLGSRMDDLMASFCVAAGELGILQRRTMVIDGTKMAALRSQWSRARIKADEIEELEAEAMTMTMVSHGQHLVGYNVQVAADADSGILVGYVVSSSADDFSQVGAVCEAVKRQSGELSERAVCDKGYDSSQNALALKEHNVEAYLPAKRRKKKPPFTQNNAGEMVCRQGHPASKHVWIDRKRGNRYDLYIVGQCKDCPFNSECPGKAGRQRQMKVLSADQHGEKQQANQRCATDEGRKLLRIRGQTIERPFAIIKERFGLRKFKLRGRNKASIEFGLAVLTFNLQTLAAYI